MASKTDEINEFIIECKDGLHTKVEIAEFKTKVDVHLDELNNILGDLEEEIRGIQDLIDDVASDSDTSINLGLATEDLERKQKHAKKTTDEKNRFIAYEAALIALLSADKNFNKQNCFANIRALLKENPDIKIGMIEKEAGIRLGYMARLEKPNNTSEPSMEFVVTAAKMLGVTVDMLISGQIEGLNGNQRFVLNFLDTLIVDTLSGDMNWEKETPKELENVSYYNGEPAHCLMKKAEHYEVDESGYPEVINIRSEYNSLFFDDEMRIDLMGNVYHIELPRTDTTVYVAHIEHSTSEMSKTDDQYEVSILQNGNLTGLCGSCQSVAEIRNQIVKLYMTIDEMNSGLGISNDIKNTLGFYMSTSSPSAIKKQENQDGGLTFSIGDDDLPFE
jgi:hypothetical protein